ncbi:MAG: thioredoxin family protein [Dissulfurispiraceae bacterium]
MDVKVLGPGCANCIKMEELVKQAIEDLGIEAKIDKISDVKEILKYTMSTPGLVINGKLKHSGKPLPGIERMKLLLKEEQ